MRKTMFILTQLFTALMLLFIIGCGGKVANTTNNPNGNTEQIPWDYDSGEVLRSDAEYLYAEAFATSKSLELATTKSEQLARAKISQQVEVKVESLFKSFIEEVGGGEDSELLGQTTNTIKAISSNLLVGSRAVRTKWRKNGMIYEAYALMELPLTAPGVALIQNLRNNKHLYERFRASQSFKELEDEVEKLEEYKRQQGLIR